MVNFGFKVLKAELFKVSPIFSLRSHRNMETQYCVTFPEKVPKKNFISRV